MARLPYVRNGTERFVGPRALGGVRVGLSGIDRKGPTTGTARRVAPVTHFAQAILDEAPLAYYRLDDPSGTTMTDVSGNSRNGTYFNSPTLGAASLIPGDPGNAAVTFDGTNDYAATTYAAWMDVTTFSATALIRLNATGAYQQIWDRDNGGVTRVFQFRVSNTNKLELIFWLTSTGPFVVTGTTTLTSGVDYFVVATYDGTTARVYLNGVEDGSTTQAGSLKTGNMKLVIGASESGGGGTPSVQWMNGRIDEAAFFGRALDATTVLALNSALYVAAPVITAPGAASGTGSITISGTAGAAAAGTATGSITVSGSATASASPTATGSITVSASGTASASPSATGSLTISGDAAASGSPTATGSIVLDATGTATSPGSITATGSITVSGSATAAASPTASGSITVSGSATAQAAAAATGSLSISGSATARAAALATASISVSALAAAAAQVSATALINLVGTATATSISAPEGGTAVLTAPVAASAAASVPVGATASAGVATGATAAPGIPTGATATPGIPSTATATIGG